MHQIARVFARFWIQPPRFQRRAATVGARRRAILYAAAAGDAVLGVYLCHIGAAAHVGGIEQLGCTEGVADLDVAVADCEDLSFTVDVCNLMHETVVFSLLENGHSLIVGNVMAAAGFAEVVCHVTDADAPVAVIVGTAFFQFLAAVTAAADAYSKMAFILFEPVGDMLDVGFSFQI
jgi:hypothetical protein